MTQASTPPRVPRAASVQEGKQAINAALDLFQRRWMLRVIWELRGPALTFRALQAQCGGLSPTVLNQRLAELRDAGLVALSDDGYCLLPAGRELITAFEPLTRWSVRWQRARQRSAE